MQEKHRSILLQSNRCKFAHLLVSQAQKKQRIGFSEIKVLMYKASRITACALTPDLHNVATLLTYNYIIKKKFSRNNCHWPAARLVLEKPVFEQVGLDLQTH